jgi:photosystem II stability/assembly factor-like uncharacterized protein
MQSVTHIGGRCWLAAGDRQTMYRSCDDGANWEPVDLSGADVDNSVDFLSACFITENAGWVSGTRGTILFTEDGGKSWGKARTNLFLPLTDIDFYDELNGMAVGSEGTVLVSNNGGRTWTKLDRVSDVNLVSVKSVAKKQQWVVGQNGTILRCDW